MIWVLVGLFALYVLFNLRRLARGKRWAVSICQLAKEWETAERVRLADARASRPYADVSGPK